MITLPDGRYLYTCPDIDSPEQILQAFLGFIQSAKQELLICDYSFNLPQFETILPALKARGVVVRLVLDKSQSKGSTEVPVIKSLQASDIDMVIGTSSLREIIHDKFAIVDNDSCWYGSYNFTTAAGKEDNFAFVDNTTEVVSALTSVWNRTHDWIVQNEPQTYKQTV